MAGSVLNKQKKMGKSYKKSRKKWTAEEIYQIVEYIINETEFEKPTAQSYYTKFLTKTNLNTDWNLVRWKVRHLKTNFLKAKQWRQSTEAKSLETTEGLCSVKSKLKKMCPYYYQLKDIFGKNEIVDENPLTPSNFSEDSESLHENQESDIEEMHETIQTSQEQLQFGNISKHPIDKLIAMQIERNELQKIKIQLEQEKLSQMVHFNQQKLQLEEMKINEEIERRKEEIKIRQLEIEKDEQLKRLEIEMQETIQMYEIEMKYKLNI